MYFPYLIAQTKCVPTRVSSSCRTTCRCVPFVTREGTLADVDAIAELEYQNFQSWSYEQIRSELSRDMSNVLVAERTSFDDSQTKTGLLGWISAWYIPPFELQIIQVTVSKHVRRQGIGYQLLVDALGMCEWDQAVLEVREDNQAAIELYKKTGFIVYGKRNKYYKDGTAACLMIKEK